MANDESAEAPLTNEQLIAKATSSLESDTKTDTSLLKVLSDHILKLNPRDTAVQDAVSEIEALADKRAEEPED
jgi:hypothetical protein